MKFVNKDITDATFGFVCHQCNCQGVMGAGVALAIRRKWPIVYSEYRTAYTQNKLKLGNVIFVMITNNLYIANLCGQDRYGRNALYTDYQALDKAIHRVSWIREKMNKIINSLLPVYFPNHMGCALAGGDWNIVLKIIEKHIPDAIIVNYTYKK